MKTVFLDTVGLLALWDSTDQWHEAASRALGLIADGVRTISTSFVLLECGNAAARRSYRGLVEKMRVALESGGKLIVPTQQDWEEAWAAYITGPIGGAGIVDHISFIVMRRMGIQEAFTNDRHFKAAGFIALF